MMSPLEQILRLQDLLCSDIWRPPVFVVAGFCRVYYQYQIRDWPLAARGKDTDSSIKAMATRKGGTTRMRNRAKCALAFVGLSLIAAGPSGDLGSEATPTQTLRTLYAINQGAV